MADKPQEARQQNGGDAAETIARPSAQAARGAWQAGQETTPRGTPEAPERGKRAAAGTPPASAAGSETPPPRGADTGPETARHLGAAAGAGVPRATEEVGSFALGAAERFEEMSARMALAMQDTVRDMRALFALPTTGSSGMQAMQEGVGGLMDGMLRANAQMMQEMFRLTNPANAIELQRRMGMQYFDIMLQSGTTLMRAARRAADDALRSLEERTAQRREPGRPSGQGRPPQHGRVADVMETDVRLASPDDTVQHAAQLMREADAGMLPVRDGDRLVGMVTDRDLAVRLAAEGRDPRQTRVREVMTPEVRYVFEDEDLDHVAENMAEQQVRRLPVMSRAKRLVGVISIADLARKGHSHLAGRAMTGIAREGGRHTHAAG